MDQIGGCQLRQRRVRAPCSAAGEVHGRRAESLVRVSGYLDIRTAGLQVWFELADSAVANQARRREFARPAPFSS